VFSQDLDQRLSSLSVPSGVRQQIDSQRSKLAAIQTTNPDVRKAIAESFVAGYRSVLWIAVGLSFASALSAALFVSLKSQRTNEVQK
jgi:hypothetical protein